MDYGDYGVSVPTLYVKLKEKIDKIVETQIEQKCEVDMAFQHDMEKLKIPCKIFDIAENRQKPQGIIFAGLNEKLTAIKTQITAQ